MNIFDKMLSEEMLSMKQKFFEKDLVQLSTASKIKQSAAPTPTIEVQQRWSVVDLFTSPPIEKTTENEKEVTIINKTPTETELALDESNKKSDNISENKVLELRSLPLQRHAEAGNQGHQHISSKCSCTRQISDQKCTHTVYSSSTDDSLLFTYSVYPLYVQPYQSFFYSDNKENLHNMYVSKKPKRRKTTPNSVEVYYDDDNNKEDNYDSDNEYSSRPKHKPRPSKVIMNINYDLDDDTPKKVDGNANNFNLINDLNDVYNNGVKKKCYCSQSTLISPDPNNIFKMFMIVQTLTNFCNKMYLFE